MKGRFATGTAIGSAMLIVGASLAARGVAGASGTDYAASLSAFEQMASVMTSPRCENCHTVTGFPRQGDDRHPHRLNVMRGKDGRGMAAMGCSTCHGRTNNSDSGVPGADDDWRLAPLRMGWEGLSVGELCRHLKRR